MGRPAGGRKLPSNDVLMAHVTEHGMSPPQIALLYGVSNGSIYGHLKAAGYEPRQYRARVAQVSAVHANRKMPSASTLEQIAIDEPGITPQQMADRFGVSIDTAYRQLRRCGIRLSRAGRLVPPDVELRELLRTESLEDLAARFGVSVYSMRNHSYRLRVDVATASTARPLGGLSLPTRAISAAVSRLEDHRRILEITGNRHAILGVTAEIEGLISLQSQLTALEGAAA